MLPRHHAVPERGLSCVNQAATFASTPEVQCRSPQWHPLQRRHRQPTSSPATQHAITYLRLLDAHIAGADWREAARIILHVDPVAEPGRARRAWETHLARAQWLTDQGYRHLLRGQS